jgi:hypothetical protein
MNGAQSKIEIFKPFGEAFELMKKILFQPFDLSKWCVIGFAAFLSGHFAAGGFGFSPPIPWGRNGATQIQALPRFPQNWPWLATLIAIWVLLSLVLIVVLSWLKARGTFIFTDCIVRNRAAIAEPWREYRKEGNSYFLFLLVVGFGALAVVAVLMFAAFIPLGLLSPSQYSGRAAVLAISVAVIVFLAWILFAIAFGVVSYFMVPVMYIRRCRAAEAFHQAFALVRQNLEPFALFVLFVIVLFLGVLFAGTIVACATCCIASLPYVGTVILLPAFVWLRGFGLLFLRQFGPDYDVWTGLQQAGPPPPLGPPPLPA